MAAVRTRTVALLLAVAASAAVVVPAWPAAAQEVVEIPARDKALPVDLQELSRVGSIAGADWETFGDVGGVGFDAKGQLYVFDRQSSRVVVTDVQGELVRIVGKAGEGPGELRMPVAFTVLRDGTIVIADMGHRAYQPFGPDGAFERMVSFGGTENMIRIGDLSADPRGGAPPALPTDRPTERISLGGATADATLVASG